MRALVQMYVVGEDYLFVAATDKDHSGRFRLLAWGHEMGIIDVPYPTAEECDAQFVEYDQKLPAEIDGPPVVAVVPCLADGEQHNAWLERAMKSMEEQVVARLKPW